MINLASEPSLGSLVISRDGVLKYSYILPRGMTFPSDVEGEIRITDRAGGEYGGSPFAGEVSDDLTRVNWVVSPDMLEDVPAGANFEVFVTFDDNTYKVRYGRVVRREVSYPLNPLSTTAPPLMYEDDLQRDQVGSRWISKYGRPAMHDKLHSGAADWGMAARNTLDVFGLGVSLWQSAAVLWYAPLQSDTIEISAGICDGGDGDTTIVLCSNYSMTSFLGVRFHDPTGSGDAIQIVTGTAWNNLTQQGTGYNHIIPDNGYIYTIRYSLPLNKVSVFIDGSTTAAKEWTDTSGILNHGAGFRYTGAIFQGSFVDTGPRLYYWKAKDAV